MLRDAPPGLEQPRKKRRRKRDKWILRTTEHGDKTISDVLSEHLKTTLDERMRDYTKVFIKITAEERERGACEFCRFQGILQRVHTNRLPMRDIIQQVIDSHQDTISSADNWGDVVEALFNECKHMQDTKGHLVVACHRCNPYLEDVEKDMVEFFRQHPHSWKDYMEWVEKRKKAQCEAQPQRQISDFFDAVATSPEENTSPSTEVQSSSDSDSVASGTLGDSPELFQDTTNVPVVDEGTPQDPQDTRLEEPEEPEEPETTLHIYNNNEEILHIGVDNMIPKDIDDWTNYPMQHTIMPPSILYSGPLDTKWAYGPIPRGVDWRALLVIHDIFQRAGFRYGEYTALGTAVRIYDWLVANKTYLLTQVHTWIMSQGTKETALNAIRSLASDADIRIRRKHISIILKVFVTSICKGEFHRKKKQTRYHIRSQAKPKNHSHYMYRLCFDSSI